MASDHPFSPNAHRDPHPETRLTRASRPSPSIQQAPSVMSSAAPDPTDGLTHMEILVHVAAAESAAAAAGGSLGGHTTTSNKRPRQRECENARRPIKPGQVNGGASSSSAKAQPPCKGKNCSVTIKPKQGKYCKVCKGTNNFHCSHWLCVANGLQEGHDTLPKYGDPCPHNGVTCATVNCRRKIAASAASRGTHTICDSCRPRGARRGMKTKQGKRKNESLSHASVGGGRGDHGN